MNRLLRCALFLLVFIGNINVYMHHYYKKYYFRIKLIAYIFLQKNNIVRKISKKHNTLVPIFEYF